MKKFFLRSALVALVLMLLASCSSNYVDVIPHNAKAVLVVNPGLMKIGEGQKDKWGKLIGVGSLKDCGINLKKSVYVFEAQDGMMGLVAELSSDDDVRKVFSDLVGKGLAKDMESYKGADFFVVNNSFLVGFSSDAILVMGPSVAADHIALRRRMAKYLEAKSDNGFAGSEMYARLEQIDAPVGIVAQLKALPENVAVPFSMSLPKDVPLEKCLVEAAVKGKGKALFVEGETFSLDQRINDSIKAMKDKFRPVGDSYLYTIPSDRLLTLTCAMKGDDLLNMMRSNYEMRTLLFGVNTSIDIDKMVRSVDGQIVVGYDDNNESRFTMLAEVSNTEWLADVDYWKRSAPEGTSIESVGDKKFRVHSDVMDVFFGVDNSGKMIYITSDNDIADNCQKPSAKPLADEVRKAVEGKRLAVIVSLAPFVKVIGINKEVGFALDLLGNIDTFVVTEK